VRAPLAGNLLSGFQRGFEQRIGRKQSIDETDAKRGFRVDRLTPQHEFLRPGRTDAAHETPRTTEARNQTEVDLRLAEARLLGCVDPIARTREFATSTQRVAVHGRDRGDRERFEGVPHRVPEAAEGLRLPGVERTHLGDVRSRRESPPLSGQHDRAHGCVRVEAFTTTHQLFERGAVERIERLRAVENQQLDGAAALDSYAIHGCTPLIASVDR
jgi:hypothetical protein